MIQYPLVIIILFVSRAMAHILLLLQCFHFDLEDHVVLIPANFFFSDTLCDRFTRFLCSP